MPPRCLFPVTVSASQKATGAASRLRQLSRLAPTRSRFAGHTTMARQFEKRAQQTMFVIGGTGKNDC